MSAVGSYQNWPPQSMFRHCNTAATKLIRNAKEVAPITHNTRPVVTTNKNNINPQHLDAIFQKKRSLRSKIRKDLKNMDPLQRIQEDHVIQNIVLESPWFKASKRLCAYISCATLREVDTSRIVSEVLCYRNNGLSQFLACVYSSNILWISRIHFFFVEKFLPQLIDHQTST